MSPTAASSRDLARALASRLDAVAPEGLEVRADGDQVSVYRDQMLIGGSAAPRVVDDVLDDRSVETAAYSTINAVQDVFAEELTTPWPASSGDMPDPGTRVTDGVLLAWFGSAQQPVVALEPIDISGRSDEPA